MGRTSASILREVGSLEGSGQRKDKTNSDAHRCCLAAAGKAGSRQTRPKATSATHTMLNHEQNNLTGHHLINLSKKRDLERQGELFKYNQNFPFVGPFHAFSAVPAITQPGEVHKSFSRAFRVLAPRVQCPGSSRPKSGTSGLLDNLLLVPATTTGYRCGKGC